MTFRSTSNENSLRPLAAFHCIPRYEGDLHRADMAWALHASSHGLSEQQISDEILHARDLSKKGRIHRQVNLCGKNSDHSAQEGRVDPLSAAMVWTAPAGRPLLNAPSWGET